MSRQQATREIAIHCANILNIIHAETPADRVASARVAFDDVCDARDALLANAGSLAAAICADDMDSTAAFYLDMGRLYGRIINLERARG